MGTRKKMVTYTGKAPASGLECDGTDTGSLEEVQYTMKFKTDEGVEAGMPGKNSLK